MSRAFPIGLVLLAATQTTWTQQPRTHELALTPEHVHWGYYDSRVPPVLRIASGDRVRVETMVAGGLQRLRLAGASESEIPESLKAVELRVTERGPGVHPMTGPIFVEGAEPGDTLEIRILAIEFLHPFGVVAFNPGGGVLPDDFPYAHFRLLRWQPGADRVEFRPGVSLTLAPFFGSIGVAPPPLVGRISSRPPGWHGGNLDNKDLVAGSTLVPAGARAGRPAVDRRRPRACRATAKSPARRSRRRFGAHSRCACAKASGCAGRARRRRRTTSAWDCTRISTKPRDSPRARWSSFSSPRRGCRETMRTCLCSLAADLHVTQAVDQTKGVHATIAKSIFK